jgi:hypothetical protein
MSVSDDSSFGIPGKITQIPSLGSSPHAMAGRFLSIHTLLIAKGET